MVSFQSRRDSYRFFNVSSDLLCAILRFSPWSISSMMGLFTRAPPVRNVYLQHPWEGICEKAFFFLPRSQ